MPGMPSRQSAAVDTRRDGSLSFAPLDRPVERAQPSPAAHDTTASDRVVISRRPRRRPRLIVEGLRPGAGVASIGSTGGDLGTMSEYPIQVSKVQAPPLREETLARDRLLDWLSVKIHRRVVLLTAEAGYGKTTLLADFSRRTRLRVLWFRLDRGDRDWVGFLAYLVAAVRVHVPDFGPSTSALLRETATTAPTLDTVLDTFLRELGGLSNDPTAIVFDDVHLVDDSPDVRYVLRELLVRGPERMSFVFASRREPPVRLARLRALGEVAELGTDDLRFDAIETERLFRETYEMRLEPAVLTELRRRTEGWAASLQLVRAALHDRDPGQVRAFISSLSGAEGHLYEYLAEEVIGDLPADLQQFLMRTSLLETVDLVLGPVAADVDEAAARNLIEDGERHGLFGRGGPNTRHVVRAHPLVRDFLQARLSRSIGDEGVRGIHLRIARAAESLDWRVAGRHYLASGDTDDAHRVLSAAIENILATGAYAAANDLVTELPTGTLEGAPGLVLRSRLAQQRADVEEGRDLAELAHAADPNSAAVLLNLVSARSLAGDLYAAIEAGRMLEQSKSPHIAALAITYRHLVEASIDGSLATALTDLHRLGSDHRLRGEAHFLGVTLCNESQLRLAVGDAEGALACADEAISLLGGSSAGIELISAHLARGAAKAHLGDIAEARSEIGAALASSSPGQRLEVSVEAADIELLYGQPSAANGHLDLATDLVAGNPESGDRAILEIALAAAESGQLDSAEREIRRIQAGGPHLTAIFELRRLLVNCLISVLGNRSNALDLARGCQELAIRQGAKTWEIYAEVLAAFSDRSSDPSPSVIAIGARCHGVLSMAAEVVVGRLDELSAPALAAVHSEAAKRPWRWREPCRRAIVRSGKATFESAVLLDLIGEIQDVKLLRSLGRSTRDARRGLLGRGLARRLASPVLVEDLGRLRIIVGSRLVDGSEVRRKVLALLALLLTKSKWTATREEVVDSIWPDQDPQSALNSLNQTVYFLRRVFETEYREDLSPGYVQQDGETIWIDSELVDARSRRCLRLIRGLSGEPDDSAVLELAKEYQGRFAIDFAYEEWSSPFRDGLHAQYLRVMEQAVRSDIDSGQVSRGLLVAERVAEIEPDSEEIQLALIRVYQLAGAHAAAAESYVKYSRALKELGVEAPPMSDL
jgi:ATP/maltotriose-dependent transcriptional regulator MalT/DNA-binding SARP family transcriptional activator